MPALGLCSSRILHLYNHIAICCPCSSTPPLTFRSSSVICFWNISGALVMPNSKRQKHYLLKGVTKVVNLLLVSSSGICQKPLVASRLEKIVASTSLEVMSSKVGRTYFLWMTALFSHSRLTHILFPFILVSGTIGAHHGVRSETSSIMPSSCILSNSCLTFVSMDTVRLRCTFEHYFYWFTYHQSQRARHNLSYLIYSFYELHLYCRTESEQNSNIGSFYHICIHHVHILLFFIHTYFCSHLTHTLQLATRTVQYDVYFAQWYFIL